eukprot:gene11662-8044_t
MATPKKTTAPKIGTEVVEVGCVVVDVFW